MAREGGGGGGGGECSRGPIIPIQRTSLGMLGKPVFGAGPTTCCRTQQGQCRRFPLELGPLHRRPSIDHKTNQCVTLANDALSQKPSGFVGIFLDTGLKPQDFPSQQTAAQLALASHLYGHCGFANFGHHHDSASLASLKSLNPSSKDWW